MTNCWTCPCRPCRRAGSTTNEPRKEPRHGHAKRCPGWGSDPRALQAAAPAHGSGAVRRLSAGGGAGAPEPSAFFGRAALGRVGGAGAHHTDAEGVSEVERRLKEAHLPRLKTLEEFDFAKAPHVSATQVLHLSQGGYLDKSEPVLFIGDSGTGKTHLATGLCVAACRQKRRVRFATAAGLVNELVEAQHFNQLGRALSRWSRYDLICIDEVGYVPLAELGAEFLFQVISERAERAAVLITTNLPFSEWTQVFTNARLCKALLDRLTDRAHIIETGTDSYRFRRTLESRRAGRAGASKSPVLPASSGGPEDPSNHVGRGAKDE